MTEYGYFLAAEEHGPADLVEQARMAEQAGFSHLWISDHYHPWNAAQGQSSFVWSVIGALAHATSLPVQTAVTCPTMRIHPAIVAQAAATSAVLLEGRFRLGVGSGEALNEHVLGDRWPPAPIRLEMLEEAVMVMRQLFEGRRVTHHGKHYTVENARLYTVPEEPVPIDIAAFGSAAAALAGRVGDGFITMTPDAELVARFRRGSGAGGNSKPARGGLKVAYGPDPDEALRTAHRLWPTEALPGELLSTLTSPGQFEQAAQLVTPERVADEVVCGDDADAHVAALNAYAEAGFDTVYVNQIGPDQRGFFDFYRTKVLPQVAG
ncbi:MULTISPECIES: TIGR03557 family F420-dependent LLM class oxidoreductase [unclassified Streptomyces]|uniref:TIGR03557 family F420-dependent LLM class oxidoreductase n=1 Tax=unclassified Streptomyces TaxID=2593676 RepID=UPI00168B0039|nr:MULTISPECIES: TIGR03557 family F420-dependent LLM class oxidoreductase [unclassified Streptomyces]MBD3006156.1 TIGR03557 family F420-dependent LLM class oxidoreductase [Streptomyces sp. 5-10]